MTPFIDNIKNSNNTEKTKNSENDKMVRELNRTYQAIRVKEEEIERLHSVISEMSEVLNEKDKKIPVKIMWGHLIYVIISLLFLIFIFGNVIEKISQIQNITEYHINKLNSEDRNFMAFKNYKNSCGSCHLTPYAPIIRRYFNKQEFIKYLEGDNDLRSKTLSGFYNSHDRMPFYTFEKDDKNDSKIYIDKKEVLEIYSILYGE